MAKQDKSPKIHQRDKFKGELKLRPLNWTENQQKIVDTILDKQSKIVFINGPAGSGKSSLATYCGLKLLSDKTLSDYLYIRNVLEVSDSAAMGYIKGDIDAKFDPYCQIFKEKSEELMSNADLDKLMHDNRVHFVPINYVRGSNWAVKFIHVEEAANFTQGEYKLLLTRYASFSKLIFCGDTQQTDLPEKKRGAFARMLELFNNDESREKGIYTFNLDKCDIKRSDITSFLIDKLNEPDINHKDYRPSQPK
ncbi:MAG: hypothetical protein EKK57_02820 [Proteobacteria bacterium]|nr:MAG: hypothetical protein EKK57_02820 [Pseudomonadota bacterium]